jgi:1-acyl-sn-glycerol-3-phosphate acyltransferase
MMAACGDALESGSSIMIFPEGTRSVDGELRDFKHGAFTLALRHHVPILPIVLDGTLDALPKHGVTLHHPADIVIQVLDPIPVDGFTTVEALRDHVRAVMGDRLRKLRAARLGAAMPPERAARSA